MAIEPQQKTHPIHKNEGFTCENCKKSTPKAQKSCRNHCKFCLFSKHVDKNLPGDRKSTCNGLMEPISIVNSKKGSQITHKCLKCNYEQVNIVAPDDEVDTIIQVMKKQNLS